MAVMQLYQYLPILAVLCGLTCAFHFLVAPAKDPISRFWDSQPTVGRKDQQFFWLRNTLRSVTQAQSMVAEGYARFSKSNLPFILPTLATGPVVIIPPSQIRHILSKPENIIDAYGPQNETIQAAYMIGDEDIYLNNLHFEVVRKQLTKNLGVLTGGIAEELALAFERRWGTSQEWTTIRVYESLQGIVAQAANRVFVGSALCRNEKFLEHSRKYAMCVFGGATIINMLPPLLRPIVGPLVALTGKRHLAICQKLCLPIVEERLRHTQRRWAEPDYQWEPPKDGLQWLIEMCEDKQDPKQLDAARIAHRLLMLNMVSIPTTSFTMANTILDLYSSDPSRNFVDGLREECDRVLTGANGIWSKDAVSALHRVDSTIRESMRFSTFGIVALPRRVSASKGIKLENNINIPEGARLGIPMHEIHHDRESYYNPSSFDAFRFSHPQEIVPVQDEHGRRGSHGESQGDAKQRATKSSANKAIEDPGCQSDVSVPTMKQLSVVTGGDTFLGFGYGKHSCPGRFFAAHEMKLLLAHVVQQYDIEFLPERPMQQTIMETKLPSSSACIRVRLRT